MPDKLLLIVDLQVGLFNIVRDYAPTEYVNNMMGYASLGRVFDIPVFMTTSAEQGPNGPLPKEMIELYPDALLIKRQGEVNAWDNSEFHAAVRASGKKQIMIEGITTDVCTTFLALSLRAEGYSFWANSCGRATTSQTVSFLFSLSNGTAIASSVSVSHALLDWCAGSIPSPKTVWQSPRTKKG